MLGKIFGLFCMVSAIVAIIAGNGSAFPLAVVDGAGDAITLVISLSGMMCLWCGIMEVLESAGVTKVLARLLYPLLRRIFPSTQPGQGLEEITASVSANLLGIGNAATPLGIAAMKKMSANAPNQGIATDDMITFVTLNTASFSILPSTLIALRRSAGSEHPLAIVVPTWICSFLGAAFALIICRTMCKKRRP